MTIDAAAYLGPWPFRPIEGKAAGLSRMMRETGVSAAVVSPLDGLFHQDPEAPNDRLLGRMRRSNNWFAAPIVNLRMANWKQRIARYAAQPQVKAVRLAPTFHGYQLGEARQLAQWASECGLAVAVQLRMLDERFHPVFLELPPTPLADVVSIAGGTPAVRWVVSAARLHETLTLAEQIGQLANLWLDTSHIDGLDCMRRACDAVGAERLLFSTCWPFFYARSAFLKVEEAELSEQQTARIVIENATKAFALGTRRGRIPSDGSHRGAP